MSVLAFSFIENAIGTPIRISLPPFCASFNAKSIAFLNSNRDIPTVKSLDYLNILMYIPMILDHLTSYNR